MEESLSSLGVWQKRVNEHGYEYYVNSETGAMQWHAPSNNKNINTRDSKENISEEEDIWQRLYSEEHQAFYYYNLVTKESQWEVQQPTEAVSTDNIDLEEASSSESDSDSSSSSSSSSSEEEMNDVLVKFDTADSSIITWSSSVITKALSWIITEGYKSHQELVTHFYQAFFADNTKTIEAQHHSPSADQSPII